jgi:hypothetical protein
MRWKNVRRGAEKKPWSGCYGSWDSGGTNQRITSDFAALILLLRIIKNLIISSSH